MDTKTLLMFTMVMCGICAVDGGARELTLGVEDGVPCELTLVEIPGCKSIHSFAIAKYEITQDLYEKVVGENPSTVKGARLPVNNVTWAEAMRFCDRVNALVKRPGLKWTLPTSSQWLYAAKGGEDLKYPGSDEIDEVAWTTENSKGTIRPVGGKTPNGYGLYDMCGNVREWARASTSGAEWQPIVGGSVFYSTASDFSSSGSGTLTRNCRQEANGFRVVVIDTKYVERLIAAADKAFSEGLRNGTAKRVSLDFKTNLDLVKVAHRGENCYVGRTEVTQAQYEKVMGTNPSVFKGDSLPVESVSWLEAMKFCEKLNGTASVCGMRWTLPSAELWKSAAQPAGRMYRYAGGDDIDDVAWNCANSRGQPHPVGQKIPNEAGFFDMSGNVAEWCLDAGTLAGRSILGGGWNMVETSCRVTDPGSWMMPDHGDRGVGFRVCLVPESLAIGQESLVRETTGFRLESKTVDLGKNVRISLNKIPGKDYWFAVSELTQAQYESVVGKNPSEPKGVGLPVVNVSWREMMAYCEMLNEQFPQAGLSWTLPTGEQWNYAASGGQKFLFSGSGDINEVGWFGGNSGGRIHPVCQKKPNAYGLYDMTGNVRELVIEARRDRDMLFANPSSWRNADLALSAIGVVRCTGPDVRGDEIGFRVILIPANSRDVARDSAITSAKSETPMSCKNVVGQKLQGEISVAQKLQECDFLLNKDFKKNAKYYLCLFSASWCGPCRREMPRIAKMYAETLKADPDIELIHFSRDQNDEKALAWAKEQGVKFPVVKPKGGNPLNLQSRGIPHFFILKADGTLVEEGHPAKLFTEEKLNGLK